MKTLSAEESLRLALPIIITLLGLVAGIVLLQTRGGEIRSRAAQPRPTIVPVTIAPLKPEVACSSLYGPVCGSNNQTYLNACEAGQAGIFSYSPGECRSSPPAAFPNTKER